MYELKSMGVTRKMDDCGSISIPKGVRALLGMQAEEEVEILTLNDKAIVLRPIRESNELDGLYSWMDTCGDDLQPLIIAIKKLAHRFEKAKAEAEQGKEPAEIKIKIE
jgi:AbrB family looped-hinge helix DNA binding protein